MRVLTPHLTCCVVLGKLLDLAEPWFPCLSNKGSWLHWGTEQELTKVPWHPPQKDRGKDKGGERGGHGPLRGSPKPGKDRAPIILREEGQG